MFFFFKDNGDHRDLHVLTPSFPTRRSSDLEEQRGWRLKQGKPMASQVKYGAMLEVPALAEQLDVLLPKIDFLSIGTNDLTQFLFAADRANPKLAERYD